METERLRRELAESPFQMIALGEHTLTEFFGCCVDSINDKALIREAMLEAARLANATIVADVFHEFNPHGISGVVVIAESHFAIHSWPEHACVSIDLFTCSENMNAAAAIEHLRKVFKAQSVETQTVQRGRATPTKL